MKPPAFFDEWGIYEKIVANDYMHHRDFFDALVTEIAARLVEPLSIVDIGCGDAQPVRELLGRFDVARYVGIDQSEPALEKAGKSLISLETPGELRVGSMLGELARLDEAFDLAIASYALHHLASEEKLRALRECRRLLRPDGLLAVIDVFLEEGESRWDYLERWQENARQSYVALSRNELDTLLGHVRDCDIPASLGEYRQHSESAGFGNIELIREDAERLNKLVLVH
jgi:ubiquinone/menaquinone biosynthesis C-methylase UbiE